MFDLGMFNLHQVCHLPWYPFASFLWLEPPNHLKSRGLFAQVAPQKPSKASNTALGRVSPGWVWTHICWNLKEIASPFYSFTLTG